MTTVQEEIYLVPRIGKSISKTELRVILLSVIQKMGYDLATDNQHGFYLLSIARPWNMKLGFTNRTIKAQILWIPGPYNGE